MTVWFAIIFFAATAFADDTDDASALLAAIFSKCVSKCDYKCGLGTGYTKYIYTGDRNAFRLVSEEHDRRGVHRSSVIADMNGIRPDNIKVDGASITLSCNGGKCFDAMVADDIDDSISEERSDTYQLWVCSPENAQRAMAALQYLASNARGEN